MMQMFFVLIEKIISVSLKQMKISLNISSSLKFLKLIILQIYVELSLLSQIEGKIY